jgi:hypothetical protein
MNIKGVRESYHNFIFEIDVDPQQIFDSVASIKRLIQIKINSPKRPPRLIILGPPGSG